MLVLLTACASPLTGGKEKNRLSESGKTSAEEAGGQSADAALSGREAGGAGAEAGDPAEGEAASVTAVSDLDLSSMFTSRDKDGSWSAAGTVRISMDKDRVETGGGGVTAEGNSIRIRSAGTYHLTGTMTDGQVVVDIPDPTDEDKVRLVLDNVDITCSSGACLLIKSADKVFVTLAQGSSNVLSDTGRAYVQTDDTMTVDAVVFSKADLVFNGSGSLTVNAGYGHGIVSKDDLKFTSGTYEINAAGKGIVGKDSLRVLDGSFTVNSQDDALHTSNADKPGKGYVYIEGGTFDLSTGDDAVHAETALIIRGGTINILQCYEGLEGETVDVEGGVISQIPPQ